MHGRESTLLVGRADLALSGLNLGAWPDGDRRSRLVFIARGLDPAVIERSFRAFSGVPQTANGSRGMGQ
jgi:hypothetical protein